MVATYEIPEAIAQVLRLGIKAGREKDFGRAFELLAKVVDFVEQLTLKARRDFHTYFAIANAHVGKMDVALYHSNQALELLDLHPDIEVEIEIKYSVAAQQLAIGNYSVALTQFFEHLELLEHYGIANTSRTLDGIANSYDLLEQFEQGVAYHNEALEVARRQGDQRREAIILCNLGATYKDLKQYSKALDCMDASLKLATGIGNTYDLVFTYYQMGELYEEMSELTQAETYYKKGLAYLEKHDFLELSTLLNMSLANLFLEQSDIAKPYLDKALSVAQTIGNKVKLERIHYLMSSYHEQGGQISDALEHYKLHSQYKEEHLKAQYTMRSQVLMVQLDLARTKQEREILLLKNSQLELTIEQLEELSNRDALTGLYNRRYFDGAFSRAFEDAIKENSLLCVMIADIDNFKQVNDRFSHSVGDEVLKIVARIFLKNLKGGDVVARYGGEEIAGVFHATDLNDVRKLCNTVRKEIEQYSWCEINEGLKVTISIGVTGEIKPIGQMMLDEADRNLYVAKRSGKNQVV